MTQKEGYETDDDLLLHKLFVMRILKKNTGLQNDPTEFSASLSGLLLAEKNNSDQIS